MKKHIASKKFYDFNLDSQNLDNVDHLSLIFRNVKQETGTDKKSFLLACVEIERHEIGLLCLGIKLRQNGYGVIYLGTDMPASELGTVAASKKINTLCLSVVNPVEEKMLGPYLESLRSVVNIETNIYVGGRAALYFAPKAFAHLNVEMCYSLADVLNRIELI